MNKYRCEQCDSEDLKIVVVELDGSLFQCVICGCTMEVDVVEGMTQKEKEKEITHCSKCGEWLEGNSLCTECRELSK